MPLHLPPLGSGVRREGGLSRRAFLGRAAAGAAALLLPGAVRGAAPRPAGEARRAWALLADTHIHATLQEKNQRFHMAANLVRTVSEVQEEGVGAALVNGDLARLVGNPGDYRRFLELVEPMRRRGIPVHATLGNHDDRANFRRALVTSGDPDDLAERHCSSVEVDGVRWLLLDSLEKVNATPGLLGKAQIEWLAGELDRTPESPTTLPGSPAIIFLHHNPEPKDIGLKDTADFLAAIRPRRQVKAVFFGHTHTWRRWEDDGIHMVNLPATGYAFSAGEPIGWVLAAPGPEGLEIELRAIGPAHPDHGKRISLPWRKS
jgi:3',5'-cyclic AMP phosphodiesterase CpdA